MSLLDKAYVIGASNKRNLSDDRISQGCDEIISELKRCHKDGSSTALLLACSKAIAFNDVARRYLTASLKKLASDDTYSKLATKVLVEIGDTAADAALPNMMRDEDPLVRAAAIKALGDIGDPQSLPIIQKMLSDDDPSVREAAAEALDKIPVPPPEYFVALDLGSESMAAYYEGPNKREMIKLQEYAEKLLEVKPYLLTDSKKKPLPWLRTRISLEKMNLSRSLSESHVILDFIDKNGDQIKFTDGDGNEMVPYKKSLFRYFHEKVEETAPLIDNPIPNPKILFQKGAKDVIPAERLENGEYPISPEELIQYLTTQVVRNFILKSSALKNVRPEQIQLTLTVPNVYSLNHVESLKRFVEEHADGVKVEALYESEAVAYFALGAPMSHDHPNFKKFKDKIGRTYRKRKELRIVTIDIGRGTTDLSLIQIKSRKSKEKESRASHFVLARVGKSDGGNRLSYELAKYYDKQLNRAFEDSLHMSSPFDFLTKAVRAAKQQSLAIRVLENLIEKVKRSISEDYDISLTKEEQEESINEISYWLCNAINPSLEKDQWKKGEVSNDFMTLHKNLRRALVLPKNFPLNRSENVELFELRQNIEKYVKENVIDLIRQLESMALDRENKIHYKSRGPFRKKVFSADCTFVLVAGQASHFKPIQKAIRSELRRLKLYENFYFLLGDDAKQACCKGAVLFQKSNHKPRNLKELHGTYGFLPETIKPDFPYKPVDMSELRFGGESVVDFDEPGTYWFIYSLRPFQELREFKEEKTPKFYDGFTALIKPFHQQKNFRVKYDPTQARIIINDNDSPIDSLATSTYGDFNGINDNDDETIYPKVWPERLKLNKE